MQAKKHGQIRRHASREAPDLQRQTTSWPGIHTEKPGDPTADKADVTRWNSGSLAGFNIAFARDRKTHSNEPLALMCPRLPTSPAGIGGRSRPRFELHMNHLRFTAMLLAGIAGGLALAGFGGAQAHAEENAWPAVVTQTDDVGSTVSWQAVGPLVYRKPAENEQTVSGFRPLFAQWVDALGQRRETNVLYPLFTYRTDGETYRWSVFQLINRGGDRAGHRAAQLPALRYETFDVWPFWFSRRTADAETSYSALFPLGGEIRARFGYDRLSFVVFPLYAQAAKRGAITTATPWPFIKTTRGTETGFAFWPLFGWREKPGSFDHRFYLWPLAWSNVDQPETDAPPGMGPRRAVGFLPFYTLDTAPGYRNENYLWPFFGYTDRTSPVRYHETRYLWPFLVQGQGDVRTVARFAPFYTHSVNKGVEKTWVVWPLYREKHWQDGRIDETQRQLFYFVYRSTKQRSRTNPSAAPAEKTNLWPLFSVWDNGTGRVQFQFPSPLEVFFPDNPRVRASWSPLFSLYRFDQRAPGNVRQEWIWGLVTSERQPQGREFHVGPLFSIRERAGEKRLAIGNGVLAWQRSRPGTAWRVFWFDFPSKAGKMSASAR